MQAIENQATRSERKNINVYSMDHLIKTSFSTTPANNTYFSFFQFVCFLVLIFASKFVFFGPSLLACNAEKSSGKTVLKSAKSS